LPKNAGEAAGVLVKGLLGGAPPPGGQTAGPAAENPDSIGQLIEQGAPQPTAQDSGQAPEPVDPAADLLKRLFGQ
jgi:hypothetical protein